MATATKAKVKISPLQDRVVIRALEETETMRGGLYIPDTAKEKPQAGEIIAVGPGRIEKGERVPMDLKVGQKAIVIGKAGQKLKQIGTEARLELEAFFGRKIFLELHVKVRKHWRDDEGMLRSLGLGE